MTEFYYMIAIQCFIVGVSFYFWLKSVYLCGQSTTWAGRFSNFIFAIFFSTAFLLIAAYWWDTIKTDNTFFSKPIPKVIEIEIKK